ncbi:MAG: pseudaminic acid synthase [Halobacteriovoraceae bacterium]|nr:pseudaminic acid synthase [Halobacteriovoraceae bacterium]|tara:strand:- start:7566 stop:8609 length:1044 start_codon:yes stop_codon:yes gene_type:complete
MEYEIAGRKIGAEYPPYIIAEVSANHNGDIDKALNLIEIAKKSGADAVKIQTYTADTMTLDVDKDNFKIKGGLWDGYTLYKLYQEAHTPWDWHYKLFEKARDIGITIFSSPFDESAVDFLEELNTPAYKVASFEATDIPLISYMAKKNKPLIMSTGMANFEEISESVEVIKNSGNKSIALLHCVSAYPALASNYNLKTLIDLKSKFGVLTGLSDHTLGIATSVASVALGACIIEKHFTHDRNDKGPDSEFSLEPDELKLLCSETKTAWEAIGEVNYKRKGQEESNAVFRRSIYFSQDLKAGSTITKENIKRIRPGFGLEPKHYEKILGMKVKSDIEKGDPVRWEDLE